MAQIAPEEPPAASPTPSPRPEEAVPVAAEPYLAPAGDEVPVEAPVSAPVEAPEATTEPTTEATTGAPVPEKQAEMIHKNSTSSNFENANFTECVSEIEKSSCFNSTVMSGWNRAKIDGSAMDTIKFQWLQKGCKLVIKGQHIPNGEVTFEDLNNDRFWKWTFERCGRYTITCVKEDGTSFVCKLQVTTSTYQLYKTLAANAAYFTALIGLLAGAAVFGQWFARSLLSPPVDANPLYFCNGDQKSSQDTTSGVWTTVTDRLTCCAYAPNLINTPEAEVVAVECNSEKQFVLNCGFEQSMWGGPSGKLYNTLQQQWSSSLKKEITVDSPQCNAVTLITPPALVSSPVPISATEAYGAIMVDNSIIPIILACLIMVVGPVLLVFNCVRPEPLTSFGRGFDYTIHSNLRSFLGLNALCLFVVVLNAWTAYGMNGNAIELLMLEVNGLTAFIGMQLGEASGSLAQALNQTNYLNTEYEKHEGGFYRNEYCPAQIGGNAITDDQCYAALKAYPNFLTKYAAGQIVSPREAAAYRYGGPPGALMGDYMFCPMPADMANPTGPEITEFTFCLTQLVVFYNMGHALAGYPGEGRVFEPDLTITCCRLGKCVDVDGEFAVANSETHTCTQGLKAPFLVSSEITRLLTTLDTEAKNSESYSELGKQMIETIMRLRQVMVYFMMQISLVSAATTAAGSFRADKKLITSGGWIALIGLVIALFSYAINKPIAVMITDSVEVLVRAGNDMSSLTEEEKQDPLIQILAYCKPAEEGDATSGFDLTFASSLANMISGSESDDSATTPAAVKLSIEAATQTMTGLMMYFQSSPQLVQAMGNGVELIPVINHIFDAVRNIISIIDCGVAFTFFENMIEVLDIHAVPTFQAIASSEWQICCCLLSIFVVSRFTAFVLDRPRKMWYCAETDRWFRFRCAYNAHVSLLNKKKKGGMTGALNGLGRMARGAIPSFSCIGLAMTIAAVFHVTLFVMIPNAFMAMGGSGFRGVPSYVPYSMLLTSIIGLASTWTPSKSKLSAAGAIIAVLLALVTSLSCVLAMAVQAQTLADCAAIFQQATNDVAAAEAAGEQVSYAEAVVEAQNDGGLECSFTDISDYAQSMIFCLVNFLMTFVCFLGGICYLCARSHMMTDSVRKTMLKVSKKGTAEGDANDMIENMGGQRADGLASKGSEKLMVQFKRFRQTGAFKMMVIGGCLTVASFSGVLMKDVGDTSNGASEADWTFYDCNKKGKRSIDGCCNGLESNCDRPINDVTFAGIHNSMSNGEDGWLTPNNRFGHYKALEAGYRALMIDIYLFDGDFDEDTPDTLYACHGLCSFGKRSATAEFNITNTWLEANPNEVIQIFFENPDGYAGDHELWKEFEKIGWNDKLVLKNEMADGSYSWPTMQEAINSGKRIMIMKFAGCDPKSDGVWASNHATNPGFHEDTIETEGGGTMACPKGFHKAFEVGYDTPYHLTGKNDVHRLIGGEKGAECADDPCTYNTDIQIRPASPVGFKEGHFFIMNHFITPPVAAWALDMNAEKLIVDRIEALEDVMCVRVGQIAVDFWSVGGFGPLKAAQWNNKRPVPTCKRSVEYGDLATTDYEAGPKVEPLSAGYALE